MFLGIDIGGSTISLGLVEGNKIVSCRTFPSFGKDATLEDTYEYLESLISEVITDEVDLIGIGVPSVVDARMGIVYNATNVPCWVEAHLGEVLGEHFGIPVKVNNDANCFALGAAACAGESKDIVVGVTLGTGVGTGVVVDGKILNGRNTGVGELCSIPYKERVIEDFCAKGFFTERGLDPVELCGRAEKGDAAAQRTFDEYGSHVGDFLSMVIFAYDPSEIIFGGGLANCKKYFEKSMISRLSDVIPYPETLKSLKIKYMPDPEVSLIGASLL